MTEGRLFFIGLGIWLYKWILLWAFKRSSRHKTELSRFLTGFLHGFFFLTIGILLAVTIYAYLGHVRGFLRIGTLGGVAGFLFGFLLGLVRAKNFESKKELLAIDLEWAQTASSAVIMASVIMYTLVQAFKIPSGSMHPTLYEGDYLFVNKFYYGIRVPFASRRVFEFHQPQRGDVVVFRFPSQDSSNPHYAKDFIKRAIGLPGDVVEIKNKEVFINGKSLGMEPYTQFVDLRTWPTVHLNNLGFDPSIYQKSWQESNLMNLLRQDEIRDNFGPVTVPQGHYFCMGDNRDSSYDSRFWGPLPSYYLRGKAWFLYWPPKRVKVIK